MKGRAVILVHFSHRCELGFKIELQNRQTFSKHEACVFFAKSWYFVNFIQICAVIQCETFLFIFCFCAGASCNNDQSVLLPLLVQDDWSCVLPLLQFSAGCLSQGDCCALCTQGVCSTIVSLLLGLQTLLVQTKQIYILFGYLSIFKLNFIFLS